jgi:hypothetical protein
MIVLAGLTLEGFVALSLIHQAQVVTLAIIVGGTLFWVIDSKIFATKEAEKAAKDDYEKAVLERLIDIEEHTQFTTENADLKRQTEIIEAFITKVPA